MLLVQLPLAQREGIPHHLIDILQPDAEFSAGDFHHLGRKAAEDIIQASYMPNLLSYVQQSFCQQPLCQQYKQFE
jgi:hypothetical protein